MRFKLSFITGFLLSMVVLSGCSHMLTAADDPNGEWVPVFDTAVRAQVNLNRIELGMTRSQVLEIMGTKTHYDKRLHRAPTTIPHPSKREVAKDGNKEYEILFYYTKYAKGDESLTPIVLLDGKVSGWGWNYYRSTIKHSQ